MLGDVLFRARRYTEAVTAFHEAQAIDPKQAEEAYLLLSYYMLGRPDLMVQICEPPSKRLFAEYRPWCLALAYHNVGRQTDAEEQLQKLPADGLLFMHAAIYAQWGEPRKAMNALATAERLHDTRLAGIRAAPLLDPIRNEPEFKALERRLNFPP